jgi:hypothetical protein
LSRTRRWPSAAIMTLAVADGFRQGLRERGYEVIQ